MEDTFRPQQSSDFQHSTVNRRTNYNYKYAVLLNETVISALIDTGKSESEDVDMKIQALELEDRNNPESTHVWEYLA
ncbi:hypothetical protein CEXT_450371 [Caerostris extrusa]|uniref:Uncharacterized protein n=1 Tax=Caerostris extrusa TaxID=172846 RepID=A0AAV4XL34_CAEEX|nr:hypothetical protein CEXT_450371 [Caerostris extrusa]